MKLAVIIVNYRTPALVIECLASLERRVNREDVSVYVVDENSGDGSAELIEQEVCHRNWVTWIQLLPQNVNRGFSHGNNAALRRILSLSSPPPLVLLLNPDTLLVDDSVGAMMAFMEAHPEIHILGGQLLSASGNPQTSAFRFPSLLGEFESTIQLGRVSRLLSGAVISLPIPLAPRKVDWVAGACMMVRTETFRRIGFLDEEFFLYFEEVEFMHRAAAKGLETWILPTAKVIHLEGQATGVVGGASKGGLPPQYWYESRRHYFLTTRNRLYYHLANALWIAGSILGIAVRLPFGRTDAHRLKALLHFVNYMFRGSR